MTTLPNFIHNHFGFNRIIKVLKAATYVYEPYNYVKKRGGNTGACSWRGDTPNTNTKYKNNFLSNHSSIWNTYGDKYKAKWLQCECLRQFPGWHPPPNKPQSDNSMTGKFAKNNAPSHLACKAVMN